MDRATKILVGIVTLLFLAWLRFGGDIPLLPVLVATTFPDSPPQALMSGLADNPEALRAAQASHDGYVSFAADLLSDLLYYIGSGVIAVAFGLWGALRQTIEWYFARAESNAAPAEDMRTYVLDKANRVLAIVSKELDAIKSRLTAMESSVPNVAPPPPPPKTTEELLAEALEEIERLREANKKAAPKTNSSTRTRRQSQ